MEGGNGMDRKSGRRKRDVDYASLFVVALFAIMLIGIMVLSAAAGSLFDSITTNRTANMNRRGALSYTASKILASDETGSLKVDQEDDRDVLVIMDPSGEKKYETRIWCEDGYLMEAIVSDQTEDISSDPVQVAKAEQFEVSIEGQIASVTTEDGTRRIYLHSKEVTS